MTAYRVEIDCFVLPCSHADWLSDCPPGVWNQVVAKCDGDESQARAELRDPGFGWPGAYTAYFFQRIGKGGVEQSARDAFGIDQVRLLVR